MKKFKKGCIGTTAGLLLSIFSAAQPQINVGDACPDFRLANLLNNKNSTTTLSSFRGKLVLLDFSTTSCIPCLRLMPRLAALQEELKDKLQVILVTPENTKHVQAFLTTHKTGRQVRFPVLTGDTILSRYFRHQSLPHEVWINPEGRLAAITGHEYVTKDNLLSVWQGTLPGWPVKYDFAYDYNQPLLLPNYGNQPPQSRSGFIRYSVVTTHMRGIPPRYNLQYDTVQQTQRLYMINMSIYNMYRTALHQSPLFPLSRVCLEVSNPARILFEATSGYRAEWEQQNTWCYETLQPLGEPPGKLSEKLRKDLDQYFNLQGRMEARNISCWVLRRIEHGEDDRNQQAAGDCVPLSDWVWEVNQHYGERPFINETGLSLKEMRTILLPAAIRSAKDEETVRKLLKSVAFERAVESRPVELLVISEQQKQ